MFPIYIYILFVTFFAGFCGLAHKFYVHEKWQSQQIHLLTECINDQEIVLTNLQSQIAALEERISGNHFRDLCTEKGFDYLAIGNSITVHGICDYWWEEYGMAASSADRDYFQQVANWLNECYSDINACAMGYSVWETTSHDRAQTQLQLLPYLNEHIDLITVQLGENALDLETFEKDYEQLLAFLQEKAPNARILVIGDFWYYEDRESLKKAAAQSRNLEYVDLSAIFGRRELSIWSGCKSL